MPTGQSFPARPCAASTICPLASNHPDYVDLLRVGYTEPIAANRIAVQFPCGVPLKCSGMIRGIVNLKGAT